MRISDLKHRITIQKLTQTTDAEGFPIESWTDFITVWASQNNLFGREYWAAKAVQSEKTVEFIIRYASFVNDLDSRTYRIKHGKRTVGTTQVDRIFNIVFIDNVQYQNNFVKLKTLELIA